MPSREVNLRRRIKRWFKSRGGYVTIVHGGPFGKKGEGDLIICWRGQYIWIECKTATGRVAKGQRARLKTVRAAGGIALIARELENVTEALAELLHPAAPTARLPVPQSSLRQKVPPRR